MSLLLPLRHQSIFRIILVAILILIWAAAAGRGRRFLYFKQTQSIRLLKPYQGYVGATSACALLIAQRR